MEQKAKDLRKPHGIYDRFPPGAAWYDSNHVCNQILGLKNNDAQSTFYSSAQFTTVNPKNRGTMKANQIQVQRQMNQIKNEEMALAKHKDKIN